MTRVFSCLEDLIEAENGGRRAAASDVSPSLSKGSQLNQTAPQGCNLLTATHKKTAIVLKLEIERLAEIYGIEKLGFLTLTFPYMVSNLKEASRRYNSFCTHVLRERYVKGVRVVEKHRRGGFHFHLLVVLREDIRTGADFEAFERRDYRSANLALRSEWAFLRTTLRKYAFGRHELLPVKSTAEGIAKYVGKYIQKHVTLRDPADKGARLVSYFNYAPGDRFWSPHFAFADKFSLLWRLQLKAWAEGKGMKDFETLRRVLGPRWAYQRQGEIMKKSLPAESLAKLDAKTRGAYEGRIPAAGCVFPIASLAHLLDRPATSAEGGVSRQRTTNQNASPCQPGAKNFPGLGKKPARAASAEFRAVLHQQRQRLSVASVGMQQQIGFPQVVGARGP